MGVYMIELLPEDLEPRITDTIKLLGKSGYYDFLRDAINSKVTSRLTISQLNISSAIEAALAAYNHLFDVCERHLDTESHNRDSEKFREKRVFANRLSLYIGSETGLRLLHSGEKQKHKPGVQTKGLNFGENAASNTKNIIDHLIRFLQKGTKSDPADSRLFELADTYLNSLKNTALTGARQYEKFFADYPELEHTRVLSVDFERFSSSEIEKREKMLTFEDYAGQEEAVNELKKISEFVRNPRPFMMWGAKTARGFVLYGPPGTGKTYLARVFADECEMPFTEIKLSDILNEMYGRSSQLVQELFSKPGVIFVDEMETLGRKIGDEKTHEGTEQIVNTMKQVMDGLESKVRNYDDPVTFYIGATNNIEIMEPALIRPGRLKPLFMQPYGSGGLAQVFSIQKKMIIKASDGERTIFDPIINEDTIGEKLAERDLVPADVEYILQNIVSNKAFEQAKAGVDKILPPVSEKDLVQAIEKYERSDESMLKNILQKIS